MNGKRRKGANANKSPLEVWAENPITYIGRVLTQGKALNAHELREEVNF